MYNAKPTVVNIPDVMMIPFNNVDNTPPIFLSNNLLNLFFKMLPQFHEDTGKEVFGEETRRHAEESINQ